MTQPFRKKEISVSRQYRKRSQLGELWHQFKKNKGAVIGLLILLLLFISTLSVDLWMDYASQVTKTNVRARLQPPSWQHLFGTDEMGRDLFNRVVYGAKFSLAIGFVSVIVAVIIGVPLGAMAGYFGGFRESVIMRITDIFASIPAILMAVVIVAVLGTSTLNLMLAVGISSVPQFIRTTRAAVLTVKNEEYVEAARALGKSNTYIIVFHILPNCLSTIIVRVTLRVASAIVSASSLSFLGLGVSAPSPEWGALLSSGKTFIRGSSYLTLFPGLAIMISVLCFNLVGDGLRDAMDPKLKN